MITGAGRGLGRAFAEEAVKNGEKVIATVRKINDADPMMKNENVLPVIMDVTKKEEVAAAINAGTKKYGRIDVLINNAGFGTINGFLIWLDQGGALVFAIFGFHRIAARPVLLNGQNKSPQLFNG